MPAGLVGTPRARDDREDRHDPGRIRAARQARRRPGGGRDVATTDGAAAGGDYDPAEGSPGTAHPTGEGFPDEAVSYDDPDERPRSGQADG
jgi:hypothetical protein